MTSWRLLALALLGLLVGCAGGEPSPSTPRPPSATETPSPTRPVPRRVTPQDSGSTFTMAVGASSELRLTDPSTPDPVATGDAVLLIPVQNVTDSGAREWELRAVQPGVTTIRSTSPGYVITILVS